MEAERQEIGFATWSEAKQFGGDKSTVLFSQRRAKTYDDESLKYVWQEAQFKKLKNIIDFPHFYLGHIQSHDVFRAIGLEGITMKDDS